MLRVRCYRKGSVGGGAPFTELNQKRLFWFCAGRAGVKRRRKRNAKLVSWFVIDTGGSSGAGGTLCPAGARAEHRHRKGSGTRADGRQQGGRQRRSQSVDGQLSIRRARELRRRRVTLRSQGTKRNHGKAVLLKSKREKNNSRRILPQNETPLGYILFKCRISKRRRLWQPTHAVGTYRTRVRTEQTRGKSRAGEAGHAQGRHNKNPLTLEKSWHFINIL